MQLDSLLIVNLLPLRLDLNSQAAKTLKWIFQVHHVNSKVQQRTAAATPPMSQK